MEKRASALDLPLYFPFLPASSDTFLGRGLFLENWTGALSGSTGPAVTRLKESKRAAYSRQPGSPGHCGFKYLPSTSQCFLEQAAGAALAESRTLKH